MSLRDAINQTTTAAAHAKPFMKLMDALGYLDTELRSATKIQDEVEAAQAKKTEIEANIEGLKKAQSGLANYVNGVKAEAAQQKLASDQAIAANEKTATTELQTSLAAIRDDHEKTISAHKATIAALKIELDALKDQKAQTQAQITELKTTIAKTHAAIGA